MTPLFRCLVLLLLLFSTHGNFEETITESIKVCYHGGACEQRHEPPKITGTSLDLGRLPNWLIPYHYNIEMRPDIYQGEPPFGFDGSVEIFMECMEATDNIYLNTLELEIVEESLEVTVTEDSPVQPDPPQWLSFEIDTPRQFFIIHLDRELTVGARYKLAVSFNGTLRSPSDSNGIYWDSYQDDSGTKYLVTTQFQSSYNRYALPCFDEPSFKATFNTTLVRKSHLFSLSNMPVAAQESRGDDWVADIYAQTVVMSNYLLCFTICDFLFVQRITPRGHLTRIWTRADVIEGTQFALQVAGDFMDWLEEYLEVPFPLPKTDHIALPSKGGAMENYGLITYAEYGLLYDPDVNTAVEKQYVTNIIGHEVAHMWFGNLVTCAWWDHTWLNEGFASFFEYHGLDAVMGWKGSDLHLANTHTLMDYDCWNISMPVRIEVDSPWDAPESFHVFTYSKGGAIVRSIMGILGEETFRKGLTRYLERHAYQEVRTDDLWNALNDQAAEDGVTDIDGTPLDMKEKMDPWLEQISFPLVKITRTLDGVAETMQTVYLESPDQEMPPAPYEYKWNIPINFYTEEDPTLNTTTRVWMDRGDVDITEGVPENRNDWMAFNTHTLHYYQADYDDESRADIVRQLVIDHEIIDVKSRARFIKTAFALARRGSRYRETDGMEMTRYLHSEDEYIPWKTADSVLSYPASILPRFPDTYAKFENYMIGQVERLYDQLGWEPEVDHSAHLNQRLRVIILQFACTYGMADCIQEAVNLYDEWQQDIYNNPLHPDFREDAYCTAIGAGDQEDWDFAHAAYKLLDDKRGPRSVEVAASRLLSSMSCSTSEATLQQYLNYTFDEEQIRAGDAGSALDDLADSLDGRWVVWEHLKANWLDNATPSGVSKHSIFLTTIDGFANDDDVLELEDFIATYPPENPLDEDTYERATATVQDNKQWADDNVQDLDDWLTEHAPLNLPGDKPRKRTQNGNRLSHRFENSFQNLRRAPKSYF